MKQSKVELSPARENFYQQIEASELQQIFDYLPGIYFVAKDLKGRVVVANEQAVKLCGFEKESDMLGKTDSDIFSAERARGYIEDDQHVFQTGERIVDKVEMAPDPNNSINWMLVTKLPLRNSEGIIIGLACLARNSKDTHMALGPYVKMNEVLEHVRLNYALQIRVDDLAKMVHLSTSQFERHFRHLFKITPTKHIQNVRISAACYQLSSTEATVATVAAESGFYDQSHFSRTFQKSIGMSPSDYRKEKRSTSD